MREEQKPLLNIEIRDLFYKDLCGHELWNNRRVTPTGRRNNLWQHSASSCRCWNKGLVTGKIQHRENQTPKRVLICAKELPSWQKKGKGVSLAGKRDWKSFVHSLPPPSKLPERGSHTVVHHFCYLPGWLTEPYIAALLLRRFLTQSKLDVETKARRQTLNVIFALEFLAWHKNV